MGNAASCAPLIISTGVVKVVFPNGNLQVFTKPVKAADLMMENSGNFVCDSGCLKVGSRIHGLNVDEDLERGQVYFLLPMELHYSVLTQEEINSLTRKANKALRHAAFGKIFPEFCIFPFEAKMQEAPASCETVDSEEKFSKQRSWKPALETIVETPSRH